MSIFSLLDRLVRESNCFICLGLFSTESESFFLSGLQPISFRENRIKSDSGRLIHKENSYPPVHDRSLTVFWTVQLNPNRLVQRTAFIPTPLSNFPHYLFNFDRTYQLPLTFLPFYSLSNFSPNFQISAQTFQLQPELTNFSPNFSTSIFPISHRTLQLLVLKNGFFQLPFSTTRIPDMDTGADESQTISSVELSNLSSGYPLLEFS